MIRFVIIDMNMQLEYLIPSEMYISYICHKILCGYIISHSAQIHTDKLGKTWPEVIKLFSMLNSAEHEIYPAHC